MYKFLIGIVVLQLSVAPIFAQPPQLSPMSLSLDQQNKISEIVTNRTLRPFSHINFALQLDAVVPSDAAIQRLPTEAERLAPELKGYSYLAVEELVAIVDTGSRRVVSVMQRMRPQENTGSSK